MKHIWHERRHGQGAYCDACTVERTPLNDFADDCAGVPVTRDGHNDYLIPGGLICECANCGQAALPGRGPCVSVEPELFPGDRALYPVFTGLLKYFPNACAEVAKVSRTCNEQHNPGEPIHWDPSKSIGDGNQALRHFMQAGTRDKDGERHSAKAAWRMLEFLEREILAERKLKP